MRKFVLSALAAAGLAAALPAQAAEGPTWMDPQEWSWAGVFGTYDKAQLQRGLQVYKESCANCHGLSLVAYRSLTEVGLTEEQVKVVAAEKTVIDGPNDEGDMFERAARPADHFVSPFPNDAAARVANNGALPPDLSLINKARVNGPDYVYSLMVGYRDTPADVAVSPGMFYNIAFPGHQIAMPPPLAEGIVEYIDGTEATTEQMAKDVTAFLNWAAEPELEERKSLGVRVMIFLAVFTAMMYGVKRRLWKNLH